MERGYAPSVSRSCPSCIGDRPRRSTPSSSPVSTAATGYPRPIDGCFGGDGRCSTPHRGYDHGALVMARALARAFGAPLVTSTISRLVVDLNRSLSNPRVFSPATRGAPADLRARIVEQHYRPYRAEVEHLVGQSVSRGRRVIHISSHSFVPTLDGKVRRADVGLLYHPGRQRRNRAVRSLEGFARGFGSDAPRTPQLPVCRQGGRAHARTCACASRRTRMSGSNWRSTRILSSARPGVGQRFAPC